MEFEIKKRDEKNGDEIIESLNFWNRYDFSNFEEL